MNKFKRYFLLLCCSLVCLNGFSPVVSYAADMFNYQSINFFTASGSSVDCDAVYNESTGYMQVDNISLNDVNSIYVGDLSPYHQITDYLPEIYDYYLVFTMFGNTTTASEFSFYPRSVSIHVQNCDENGKNNLLENMKIYHHDNTYNIGYTISGRIPTLDNTILAYIVLFNNVGSVTSDVVYKASIVRVEKSSTLDADAMIGAALNKINDSINNQGANIQSAINQGLNELQQTIESQYSVSEEENFGVEDIVDQVYEKAGVLSFGTDTLVNFLDLFDAANATNTKLTFPGFSMEIQGVNYQVWPDYHYDLSELENQFGALIEVVRWGCVMVVWLAVLNYLVKAYDTIFGR